MVAKNHRGIDDVPTMNAGLPWAMVSSEGVTEMGPQSAAKTPGEWDEPISSQTMGGFSRSKA